MIILVFGTQRSREASHAPAGPQNHAHNVAPRVSEHSSTPSGHTIHPAQRSTTWAAANTDLVPQHKKVEFFLNSYHQIPYTAPTSVWGSYDIVLATNLPSL